MATYTELFDLFDNSVLRNKVTVAVGVAADIIRNDQDTGDPWDGTNHANRLVWAAQAYSSPVVMAKRMLWFVIIANRDLTAEQILGASDAAIQSNVNAVVDLFATGS